MKQLFFSLALTLTISISFTTFVGCSKSPSEKPDTTSKAEPAKPQKTAMAPAKIERSAPPSALNRARKELPPTPKPSVLENDYHSTTNVDDKIEIISNLSDVGTPEAV